MACTLEFYRAAATKRRGAAGRVSAPIFARRARPVPQEPADADGIHPTTAGHGVLADAVRTAVAP